ncbi:MAG: sialate O-acetylesterase [Vicinamibacterales bacterium]
MHGTLPHVCVGAHGAPGAGVFTLDSRGTACHPRLTDDTANDTDDLGEAGATHRSDCLVLVTGTPEGLDSSAAHVHLYLLMGQSNMAGRGAIEDEDRTPHLSVFVLEADGTCVPAIEPITRDRPGKRGVGPGLSFGKALAAGHPKARIGLVPCAVGGSPLARWEKGGNLYAVAIDRVRAAMTRGTLRGVLWHQGESDSTPGLAGTYGSRLDRMIADLRADLGLPNLAFVAGELGEFLWAAGSRHGAAARLVNAALAELPRRVAHTACVTSAGLLDRGDAMHFDTASQRELGRRFAAAMVRVQSGQ